MNELIKYISELFGLKVTSKIALSDMENDIGTIHDHAGYIRFLKSNFNLSDVQYLTAYQKFLTLTKRYKEIESEAINKARIEKMGTRAQELSEKVRAIDTMVLNNQSENPQWICFKLETGEYYFTDKEIRALESIGSPLSCVRLQRSISGRDMLCERIEALFVERVMYPQLEAPKSNELLENLAKEKSVD